MRARGDQDIDATDLLPASVPDEMASPSSAKKKEAREFLPAVKRRVFCACFFSRYSERRHSSTAYIEVPCFNLSELLRFVNLLSVDLS